MQKFDRSKHRSSVNSCGGCLATHKPVTADELFGALELSDASERWQVIHTKPQSEKKLAGYLKRNSITYYLPQLDSVRHYKYRKVTFTKPMFQGYLFARFNPTDKATVLISGYVVKFLSVPNEKELLTELVNIYNGRTAKVELTPAKWLEQGWEVEITAGPMQGMFGIVQDHTRLSEVILQVNILRQAVSVRVNPADVRLVKEIHNI